MKRQQFHSANDTDVQAFSLYRINKIDNGRTTFQIAKDDIVVSSRNLPLIPHSLLHFHRISRKGGAVSEAPGEMA